MDSLSKSGHSTTVDDRIASIRGCAYSLMGVGLHGENGGNPRVSFSRWSTYVSPRLTYGLGVLILSKSEVQKLNQFHKKFLSGLLSSILVVWSIASGGGSTKANRGYVG